MWLACSPGWLGDYGETRLVRSKQYDFCNIIVWTTATQTLIMPTENILEHTCLQDN